MGAGAGQTGGGIQTMPQMAMPQGGPTQSGLGALATQMQQNGQADPRLMAMMQAFQNQGGMPGGQVMGTFGPNDMPVPYDPRKPGGMMPGDVPVQRPMPGVSAPGGVPMPKMPGVIDDFGMPRGVSVQRPMPFDPRRPMPVGAGGKGAGAGPRVMETIGNPKGTRPGVPSTMINPPRPMVANNPRAQAAQSANPLLAQMMRGGSR